MLNVSNNRLIKARSAFYCPCSFYCLISLPPALLPTLFRNITRIVRNIKYNECAIDNKMGSHARKSLPVYDVKNQKRTTHNGTKPILKRNALPLWLNIANKMTKVAFINGTIAKIITSLRMSSAQATSGRSNRNKDTRNILFIFS